MSPGPLRADDASAEDMRREIEAEKAKLEMDKQATELAHERQALAAEKAKLAAEKRQLKDEAEQAKKDDEARRRSSRQEPGAPAAVPPRTQGLTAYLGVGLYSPKELQHFKDVITQDSGGQAPRIDPLSKVLGLRWEGFTFETLLLDADLNYKPLTGSSRQSSLHINLFSLGYDWAFIRRGSVLGPMELALPLRLELAQVSGFSKGNELSSTPSGLAFGLSVRTWATERFLVEMQGLYHMRLGSDDSGDGNNGGNNNGGGGGSGGGNNNGSATSQANLDGAEFRLNLGWRFL